MSMPAIRGNDYAKGNSGGGAPVGNNNAETHGMHTDAQNWFENHRDEVEGRVRRKVRKVVRNEDIDWREHWKVNIVIEMVITQEQIRKGDQYIAESGFIVEEVTTKDGTTVVNEKVNPAVETKSRLFRNIQDAMSDLGMLDESPEMQKVEALKQLAEKGESSKTRQRMQKFKR